MRALQRASAALIVLTVAGGLAACGDDDTDTNAFCDGVVELTGAVADLDVSEESPEEEVKAGGDALAKAFKPVLANVPDDLESDAKKLDGVITSLESGDASQLNDAAFETYLSFVDGAVDECDYPGADVKGKDYAFEAPDTVKAGTVAFSFANTSDGEEHEMVILRKQDGVDLSWEELLELPEEEAMSKTQFVAATFAAPGESSSSLTKLEKGSYAMVCFIPVGGGEDGPPHFTQGMLHEFTAE